jgi:hypothetical protein
MHGNGAAMGSHPDEVLLRHPRVPGVMTYSCDTVETQAAVAAWLDIYEGQVCCWQCRARVWSLYVQALAVQHGATVAAGCWPDYQQCAVHG